MDDTRSIFARHRLRCTEQRRALYEALCDTKTHPTAEELFHLARPRIDRLSRATVYNTLEAFCRAGLARRLPTNGCCRYDADTREHLHLRFRDTAEIRDVPDDLGRRLLENLPRQALADIERTMGVSIDGVSIQLLASRDR